MFSFLLQQDNYNWVSPSAHYQHHQQPQHRQQQPVHYPNDQYNQYQSNFGYTQHNQELYQQIPMYSEVRQQNYPSAAYTAPVPSAATILDNQFDNASNQTDDADSPVLRALLSNKNGKRQSPSYTPSPAAKRQRTHEDALENGIISPLRTEDSLDYFDDFPIDKRQAIEKSGYEYNVAPLGMTGENVIAASSIPSTSTTPLTNHSTHLTASPQIEGMNTPPHSPTASAICDASSADSKAWIQNGSDCKYLSCIFTCKYDMPTLAWLSCSFFSDVHN